MKTAREIAGKLKDACYCSEAVTVDGYRPSSFTLRSAQQIIQRSLNEAKAEGARERDKCWAKELGLEEWHTPKLAISSALHKAQAEERERCALIAESFATDWQPSHTPFRIAKRIREEK